MSTDGLRGSNRIILNAGCAIPAETPSAKLEALIDAARKWPDA